MGAPAPVSYTHLDKIIERETLTSDLNMNDDLLGEFSGVGEIKIATIAMDGLANYSREDGFVKGSVSTDWEKMCIRDRLGTSCVRRDRAVLLRAFGEKVPRRPEPRRRLRGGLERVPWEMRPHHRGKPVPGVQRRGQAEGAGRPAWSPHVRICARC